MLSYKNMLMIGAAGKNAGKTEFACKLISRFKNSHRVIGLKVTTVHEYLEEIQDMEKNGTFGNDNKPPRGKCLLTEEIGGVTEKDTVRMLQAGAEKVFWLRGPSEGLEQGFMEFRNTLSGNELIVCESNSLRRVVEPGFFMIMRRKGSHEVKPSCQAVWDYADCINDFADHRFGIPVDSIIYNDPDWKVNDNQE
jgi:hypothetical protein